MIYSLLILVLMNCFIARAGNELLGIKNDPQQDTPKIESFDADAFKDTSLSIYTENDALSTLKDQDYTGGLAVSFSGRQAKEHPVSIDWALTTANQLLNLEDKNTTLIDPLYSCEVGFNFFTPSLITDSEPRPNDRPYASVFYMANGQQSLDYNHRRAWISSLTLGLMGLDLASTIQNGIHSAIGSDKAVGWRHQISNGGEPTLKYELTRLWFHPVTNYFDFSTSTSGSLGFLTEGSGSISLRLGRIRSPWWTIDSNQNRVGSKTNPNYFYKDKSNDSYLVVGSQLKYRIYNAFLQGQFRSSNVSYKYSETRPIVLEAWVGWVQEVFESVKISYIFRYQTSELEYGLADRDFTWGGVLINMNL